jgi:TonB family protein
VTTSVSGLSDTAAKPPSAVGTVPVSIRRSAIGDLEALLSHAEDEIVGIVRGKCSPQGASIEGFEPLEVPPGIPPMQALIERIATCAPGPRPLGLFRSQEAGPAVLSELDCGLIRQILPSLPSGFFVLIRSLPGRQRRVALFRFAGKAPEPDAMPVLEFPIDLRLLRQASRNAWRERAPRLDRLLPVSVLARRWVVGAMLAAAALGGAVAYHWLRPAEAAGPADSELAPTVLGLQAVRSGADVDLTWNRASHAIQQSTSGLLVIHNGPFVRTIPLDSSQLREGHIVFVPLAGADLDFRLRVTDSYGKSNAESVQVLAWDTFTPGTPGALPPVAPPMLAELLRPIPEIPLPSSKEKPAATIDAQSSHRAGPAKPKPARITASAEPLEPPSTPRGHLEPVAVQQPAPVLTREERDALRGAQGKVSVALRLMIDRTGEVRRADVLSSTSDPDDGHTRLRQAAISAALRWRFRPAMEDGKPVPSETTVTVRFN